MACAMCALLAGCSGLLGPLRGPGVRPVHGTSSRPEVLGPLPGHPKARGPRGQAVERLLRVEFLRFKEAIELNVANLLDGPSYDAPTPDEIIVEIEARRPIIRWATALWLRQSLGVEKYGVWCPTLRRWGLHPWQWAPNEHPTLTTPKLGYALSSVRPQLTREVKNGLRTSPLRTARLLMRSLQVWVLATLANLPGPQQQLIQRSWPKLVDRLSETMEENHASALGRITAAPYSAVRRPPLLPSARVTKGAHAHARSSPLDAAADALQSWLGRGGEHSASRERSPEGRREGGGKGKGPWRPMRGSRSRVRSSEFVGGEESSLLRRVLSRDLRDS